MMSLKIATAIDKYTSEKNNQQSFNEKINFRTEGPRVVQQEMHLSDYMESLIRRKWIIILFFIIIVGSVTVVSIHMPPQFEATTQVLLGGQPTPLYPLGDGRERIPDRELSQKTQINLLRNRTLARTVIEELGLADIVLKKKESSQSLLSWLSKKISALKPESNPEPDQNKDTRYNNFAMVGNWYLSNLSVNEIRGSRLVNVTFRGPDAELITQIVNRHVETAIENTVKEHQSQAQDALEWLKAQIEDQKNTVKHSQLAIYQFKKKYNVLSLEDNQIIFTQEMRELNSELTKAKSERIAKQAVYIQLKKITESRKDVMLMPEISNYPIVQKLRNQLLDLKSQKIEMGTKYGSKHPKMIELDYGIQQIEDEIKNETNRIKDAIKAELDRALAIENSITQSLEKQKEYAMQLGERAIEYEILKQQAESSQDIYDFLLKQSEELGLTGAISRSGMRIVDKAEIPIKPVSPKILLNILMATAFSLFFSSAMVFLLDYLDNTIKTPIDVPVKLGLPFLGMIPFQKILKKISKGQPLMIGNGSGQKKGNETASSPLYHISNRLPAELRSPADGLFGRVLLVESVTMGEGKSTVVTQLASNLTDAGLGVLLVDCDFQRPSLDKLLNVSNKNGLATAIDRIMSHNLSKGKLSDYSVDDLFFLIALRKRSGHLILTNEGQVFTVHFQKGVLIHIENQNSQENSRIGNMLLNGGFITEKQLEDSLVRHRRTGQPLGYILVNAGYIGREKLRGPLRLQIEEYIQKVFSWKKGNFSFNPAAISIYENEKIFFAEDYTSFINNLGHTESSRFIESQLFSHIHSTGIGKENLYLLPAGTSFRLIGSLNQLLMNKFFQILKQHFDVILIDTPPLDAASGIESIFHLTDGIVLVIKAGHLSVKVLNGAINHLPQDKIIGTVLNQAKVEQNPYYY